LDRVPFFESDRHQQEVENMQRALCRAAQRSRSLSSSRRHASTLLVAEHDGTKLSEGTLAAITACAQMKPITLLVGGSAEMAATAAKADGVDAVQFVDNDALNHGVAEEWAPLVEGIAKTGFTHVVAGASSFSKGLFPRVSALLDVAQVSDIIGVKSEDTFVRPIYAGNALATVKSEDAIKEPLLRPAALTAPCQPRPSSPATPRSQRAVPAAARARACGAAARPPPLSPPSLASPREDALSPPLPSRPSPHAPLRVRAGRDCAPHGLRQGGGGGRSRRCLRRRRRLLADRHDDVDQRGGCRSLEAYLGTTDSGLPTSAREDTYSAVFGPVSRCIPLHRLDS